MKQANQTSVPFPADAANASTSSTNNASQVKLVTGRGTQSKTAFRTTEQRARDEMHGSRMALESRFIRLPKEVQEINRNKAATEILERPIQEEMGVLRVEELQPSGGEELICPKRPKWSYNNTKKEVEKNEGVSTLPIFQTRALFLTSILYLPIQRVCSVNGSPKLMKHSRNFPPRNEKSIKMMHTEIYQRV